MGWSCPGWWKPGTMTIAEGAFGSEAGEETGDNPFDWLKW